MKTIIKNIHLLLIILINAKCMSYIEITKKLAPEIELENKENTIQLVNMYDYTKLDFKSEKKSEVFTSGVKKVIEGLYESFERDKYFHLKINDSLIKGSVNSSLSNPLSKDTVKIFCLDNGASLLLAIEAFDIYFDKDVIVEKNEDGSKSRTAYYYLFVKVGLSLYDSTGNIIDRSILRKSEYYSSRGVLFRLLSVRPSLKNAGDEVNILAKNIGEKYKNKFYPGEVIVPRIYYTNKCFSEITPYIKNKNWLKAKDLLLPLAQSEDLKTSRRAAHNLSIVYEAIGNYEAAEYWINKSKEKPIKN